MDTAAGALRYVRNEQVAAQPSPRLARGPIGLGAGAACSRVRSTSR